MFTNSEWQNDFLYMTKQHHKRLQQYCDSFNGIFKANVSNFGYVTWLKDGSFMGMSNRLSHEELYLEEEGYQDDPHFSKYDEVHSGCIFSWPDHNKNNFQHNHFQQAMKRKLGTHITFSIIEKYADRCQLFWWGLRPPSHMMQKTKMDILRDCIAQSGLIQTRLTQFKEEFYPTIYQKDFPYVNLKNLKKQSYETQKHIINKESDYRHQITLLLKTRSLKNEGLTLQDIQLTEKETRHLSLFLQGETNRDIAQTMHCSMNQIKKYKDNIQDKLDTFTRNVSYIKKATELMSIGLFT